MLSLLIAAAAVPTAVDAERAFARDAQRIGQWTAFRRYAHPDAVLFTPQAVWAHEFLRGRKDPPRAIRWWPTQSYVSCDGRTAVNLGGATYPGGEPGHFTTVWQRERSRWRWVYDAGDELKTPLARPRRPLVVRASCRGKAPGAPLMKPPPTTRRAGSAPPDDFGRGQSADRTLAWDWKVEAGGARRFRTYMWNGTHYEQVLYQQTKGQ